MMCRKTRTLPCHAPTRRNDLPRPAVSHEAHHRFSTAGVQRVVFREVVETFDRMEFAVSYHGKKSVIPIQASFDFMKGVYEKEYEKDAYPEVSAAPFKLRLCQIYKSAAEKGSTDAKKVVLANCE